MLAIATKIFAEHGYRETGIESVLNQAGLTGPAFYRHFSSKQEILDTICIDSTKLALDVALNIQKEELSPSEGLKKLLDTRLDYLFSPMGDSAILAVNQRAHISEQARERIRSMQHEFRHVCGLLLKKVRPDLADDEIKLLFFAAQNMVVYGIWRAKTRTILPGSEYKLLLKKMIWSTLMSK